MPHRIVEACTGCTACARQCPTHAIQGPLRGLHVIDARLCIDCGVCGIICPVDAVFDAAGALVARIPRNLRARPRLDPDVCNGCGLCVDFCPFDCLEIVGPLHRGLALLSAPQACVSCAECERICIKQAIAMVPADLRTRDPVAERVRAAALTTA